MRRIVFLINLVQDVNIVRPIAYLAYRKLGLAVAFLVSDKFAVRDKDGTWRAELDRIAGATSAACVVYDSPFVAFQALNGGRGFLVAASESDLPAHSQTHDVMRSAPSTYLKITLQHGYECVGFLHNRDHDLAHGRTVGFAADIVAGWSAIEAQRSLSLTERPKYYQSGPSALIPVTDPTDAPALRPDAEALICENLHSVRFNPDGGSRDAFLEAFQAFSLAMGSADRRLVLRPHPSGKRAFPPEALGDNVDVVRSPIYDIDLASFGYGISPPSSVLIDLLLSGIPTAVWQDPDRGIDASNYAGLTTVRVASDFLTFRREALRDPEIFLQRQRRFLLDSRLATDPTDVETRFARLLAAGADGVRVNRSGDTERMLVISDSVGATQSISFRKPLLHARDVRLTMVEDDKAWSDLSRLDAFWKHQAPSVLILSRYSETHAEALLAKARADDIPILFHIDDDLLNVPQSLGPGKFAHYNDRDRLARLRAAMQGSDLVYASTGALAETLRAHGVAAPVVAGDIYCSMTAAKAPVPVRAANPTIGYMATGGHGADLEVALPAIIARMRENPLLRFETFGRVVPPASLEVFGDRITHHEGVADYDAFLARLAELGWWVGIAPLEDTAFNRCKADTKWVEYTFAGIPVVASDIAVYRAACADGTGRMASDTAGWHRALFELTEDASSGHEMVARARGKLATTYSATRLEQQLRGVVSQARALRTPLSVTARTDMTETAS